MENITSQSGELNKRFTRTVSIKLLIAVYAVVPIVVLLIILDGVFLQGSLQRWLPNSPVETLWYGIIFGLPHIIASNMTLLDRQYLGFYKKKLSFGFPLVILLSVGLVFVFSPLASFLIFTCFTLIHVIGQQTGISMMLARTAGPVVLLWKWMLICISICAALLVAEGHELVEQYHPVIINSLIVMLLVSAVCLLRMHGSIKTGTGRWYVYATQLMVMASIIVALIGYPFFTILIPRVVHDITAFIFYCVHDENRNRKIAHNIVYRLPGLSAMRVYIVLPCVAILLALLANLYIHPVFILALTFLHYYMERYTWKKGSIHREYIVAA